MASPQTSRQGHRRIPPLLAPRQIDRSPVDYANSPWRSIADPPDSPALPDWDLKRTDTFKTLNVDGGVTDNDPFQLAHDFLAVQNPLAVRDLNTGELQNPSTADKANCAVLTVAPFPARELYNSSYDFAANSSITGMLPNLFTVLVAQSRFQGETLEAVMSGTSYSRFVLAPSDMQNPNLPALQCGLLGAFGGFFERGFRAHDYQLGRRNCQKFLQDYFRLTIDNPIIHTGLGKLSPANRGLVLETFAGSKNTLPIIPLCGSAVPEVTAPPRATIASARVDAIVNLVVQRLHAVVKPLLASALGDGFKDEATRAVVDAAISTWGKGKIATYLQEQLKDVTAD